MSDDKNKSRLNNIIYYNGSERFLSIVPLLKLMLKGGTDMKPRKDINVQIGANIKREREKAGFTQEHFSEIIGIGPKSLSAIERGVVGISLSLLKKVCTVLAISSDALIFGERPDGNSDELYERLSRLSPAQQKIASTVLSGLLEAFALE